jgi:hypothetical protein
MEQLKISQEIVLPFCTSFVCFCMLSEGEQRNQVVKHTLGLGSSGQKLFLQILSSEYTEHSLVERNFLIFLEIMSM